MIPDINLLPKLERTSTSSKLVYILMGGGAILAVAVCVFMYTTSTLNLRNIQAEEQQLTTQQTELQTQLDVLLGLNTGSLEESLAFVERVSYPVSPLIDETQKLMLDDTYLRSYSFSEEAVTIEADFEVLSDVSHYVDALNNSQYFSDVQVETVSNFEVNPTGDEKTDREKFLEVPRYSTSIVLLIDSMYLATGGAK